MFAAAAIFVAPTAAFAQADEAPPARDQDSAVERHPRPDLDQVKRRALAAIERRLATIERLTAQIERAEHVTEDHAATLQRDLADAAKSLGELARAIEAADTPEVLRPLVEAIVTEHYIYVLVVPKVHEVLASDTMEWIGTRLGEFADKLDEVIERLDEAGFDVEELERLLAEMMRRVDDGVALAGPVAEKVVDLQPEDWPEAGEVLRAGREALHQGAHSLRDAHRIAHEIVRAIREMVRSEGDA